MGRATAIAHVAVAAVLAGAIVPRPCGAGAADSTAVGATPVSSDARINFDAFLSSTYSYNFNRPSSGTNQFRVFDFDDNTFKVDVVELVAQRPVVKPRDSGFRVDLTVGSSIPRVTASAGLFRDDSGTAGDIDAQQAFASWIAPVGSGLRLDFGKFVTYFGYEVIEGYDGWNDAATRSFLFGYAIPFTHVGARASYTFSPRVTAMGVVVNGWDVARDNNDSKSVGGQVALTPVAALSIVINGMWGPERPGMDGDPRTLWDGVVIFKARGLTLGANADWGSDKNGAGPGADAEWSGVAGYARATITPSFALTLRGESLNDRDGVRTGVAQTLSEFTITPELRLTPNMLVRADGRMDRSTHSVFEKSQGSSRTQPTILFNLIYSL